MSEFKGTSGKWKLAFNDYGYYTSVRNLDETRKICVSRVNNITESNANMLLISKAPEMLEMLKECKLQLEYLNEKFTETGTTNSLLSKIEQLIKQATED